MMSDEASKFITVYLPEEFKIILVEEKIFLLRQE